MKVLHISGLTGPGAGRCALDLHEELVRVGIDSSYLYAGELNDTEIKSCYRFQSNRPLLEKIKGKLKRFIRGKQSRAGNKPSEYANWLFSALPLPNALSTHPLVQGADMIHLHWVSNILEWNGFFKTVKQPVIWSLHDMHPITGGCHVSGICRRYEIGCGRCPQLGSDDLEDLSWKIFERKREAVKNKTVCLVSPSQSMQDSVNGNKIFQNFESEVIKHGINLNIFKHIPQKQAREALKLPVDKIVILFSSAYDAHHKGFQEFLNALRRVRQELLPRITILIAGRVDQALLKKNDLKNIPVYELGMVNQEMMPMVYSAADCFVNPAYQESFGLTLVEALACATPVLTSSAGIAAELSELLQARMLLETNTVVELADKISEVVSDPEGARKRVQPVTRVIRESFDIKLSARRYATLYRKILERGKR